ncbi:hypothetical protein, partial [Hamadaea tsunoensis]|uniref:hypothetical protein n=1 Tax=Hamadaea tsunoensis TaxID=53368 RepID=UPI0004885254
MRFTVLATAVLLLLMTATPDPVTVFGDPGPVSLSWLWSWLPAPAFAGGGHPSGPVQEAGSAAGRSHYVGYEQTKASGGAGRAPSSSVAVADPSRTRKKETTTGAARGDGSFSAGKSTRVASASSATSDVFKNPDGTYTRQVSQSAVNFQASDGSWQPIDAALVSDKGRLKQKANGLGLSLASRADDASLVSATVGGAGFGYSLNGASPVAGQSDGDYSVRYPQALADTDLVVRSRDTGIEESLILQRPSAAHEWTFSLNLNGLTPSLDASGGVLLKDAAGKVQGRIPPGLMHDSHFDAKSGDFTT